MEARVALQRLLARRGIGPGHGWHDKTGNSARDTPDRLVRDPSRPATAQRLAEAIGREYIRNSIERRASMSEEALRYLLEEEERLKTNLQRSEAAVADYKANNPDALQLGGAPLRQVPTGSGAGGGGPRGGLVEDKLQDLNNKLTAAKADRIRLEGELEQIQQSGDNIDALLQVPSISAATMVTEARRTVMQIEAAITTYTLRYKDKHPKMIAAKASLADAKEKLRQAVLAQPAILRNASNRRKPRKPVCKKHCKISRAWLSRSIGQHWLPGVGPASRN